MVMSRRTTAVLIVASLALVAPSAPAGVSESRDEVALRQATGYALSRLARTARALPDGRFPTVATGRAFWRTSDTSGWLAGFWPGSLWLAYELDGSPAWAREAARREAPLAVREDDATTHDLGFLLQTSFGQGARLDAASSDRAVIRRGAAALASRWVPSAEAIRSWDGPSGQVTVIVDSLMNLELLYAAGDPTQRDLATRHALTVAQHLVRRNGSTFHVVRLDETTGRRVWRGTVQGLSDTSTWARGQAWAVHGFTTAYRRSGDRRLLAAARRTADYAVTHAPADGVPWWDYEAPGTVRDASAGAVLAAALLDLARVDPDPNDRARWRRAGLHTLRSLVGPRYLTRGTGAWSTLWHARHDPRLDNVGTSYADYYLLEALLRAQLLPPTSPALAMIGRQRTPDGGLRVDLGRPRRVSGVSVRWGTGGTIATPYAVQVSDDERRWVTVRRGVSSGDGVVLETYDVPDTATRFVRVLPQSPMQPNDTTARPTYVRVRG